MRKNKWIKICIIASIFLLSSCDNNSDPPTIEQQLLSEMKDTNMEVDEISHLEVVKDGILIFYTKDNNLHHGFIKLKDAKWEWYFGGGSLPLQTDIDLSSAGTNLDDFYVYYGLINDNKIKQVKDGENDKLAKIIQTEDGLRIYFFINELVEGEIKNGTYKHHEMVPVYEN